MRYKVALHEEGERERACTEVHGQQCSPPPPYFFFFAFLRYDEYNLMEALRMQRAKKRVPRLVLTFEWVFGARPYAQGQWKFMLTTSGVLFFLRHRRRFPSSREAASHFCLFIPFCLFAYPPLREPEEKYLGRLLFQHIS